MDCFGRGPARFRCLGISALIWPVAMAYGAMGQVPTPAWHGVLQDERAQPIDGATVLLDAGDEHRRAKTAADGSYSFGGLLPNGYSLTVEIKGSFSTVWWP